MKTAWMFDTPYRLVVLEDQRRVYRLVQKYGRLNRRWRKVAAGLAAVEYSDRLRRAGEWRREVETRPVYDAFTLRVAAADNAYDQRQRATVSQKARRWWSR